MYNHIKNATTHFIDELKHEEFEYAVEFAKDFIENEYLGYEMKKDFLWTLVNLNRPLFIKAIKDACLEFINNVDKQAKLMKSKGY